VDIKSFNDICNLFYGIELELNFDADETEIIITGTPDKLPLIIGKQGRNIKAIRELLYLYNKIHETSYRLTLLEN